MTSMGGEATTQLRARGQPRRGSARAHSEVLRGEDGAISEIGVLELDETDAAAVDEARLGPGGIPARPALVEGTGGNGHRPRVVPNELRAGGGVIPGVTLFYGRVEDDPLAEAAAVDRERSHLVAFHQRVD